MARRLRAGAVLSKRRTAYAPATLRDYRADLDTYVLPVIGHLAFTDVTADDVQQIVNQMNADGLRGQTVRNVVVALAAFYRTVRRRVPANPCRDLDLPRAGEPRNRAATPAEAQTLLAALGGVTRDVYAAAFYTGLRRGELQALGVGDVDLEQRVITVAASWDPVAGSKPPKSKAGARHLPLIEPLRAIVEKRIAGLSAGALVFGRTDSDPFVPNSIRRNAGRSWEAAAAAGELNPIGLHECRRSYASWLNAAGIDNIRAARYLGTHSLR